MKKKIINIFFIVASNAQEEPDSPLILHKQFDDVRRAMMMNYNDRDERARRTGPPEKYTYLYYIQDGNKRRECFLTMHRGVYVYFALEEKKGVARIIIRFIYLWYVYSDCCNILQSVYIIPLNILSYQNLTLHFFIMINNLNYI